MSGLYVVGNSHAAALKLGLPSHTDLSEPGFFGGSGRLVRHLTIAEGRLFLDVENGADHSERIFGLRDVPLDTANAFVLVGMSFSNALAFQLYQTFTPWAKRGDDRTFVSMECFEEAIMAALVRTKAFRLAKALSEATDAAITLVEQPAVNESVLGADGADLALWNRSAHARAFAENRAELLDEMFDRAALRAAHGDVNVALQPKDTKVAGAFTAERFSVEHRPDRKAKDHMMQRDYGHANGAYGAVVWNNLLENGFVARTSAAF